MLQSYSNQNSMIGTQKYTQRLMEQNREPEMSPHLHAQLIYNKGGKNIKWGKRVSFIHAIEKVGQLHAKELN